MLIDVFMQLLFGKIASRVKTEQYALFYISIIHTTSCFGRAR
jgi:hypothetical protein